MESQAEEVWRQYGKEEKEDRRYGIEGNVLEGQPEILRGYIIRKIIGLCTNSVKDITFAHIDQVCRLAKRGTGKRISLPYGLEAETEYGVVWISISKGKDINGKHDFEGKPESVRVGRTRAKTAEEKEPAQVEKSATTTVKTLKLSHFSYKKDEEIPENRYTKWFDYDQGE